MLFGILFFMKQTGREESPAERMSEIYCKSNVAIQHQEQLRRTALFREAMPGEKAALYR
jgi:hypothetical protein